ncbi:protein I'm not dead yet-like [Battus philenor]|uniref:protein I'm not dead yet-like n=1 Tax=Battus philenor TaxID=42288 RepID=UPI0035CF9DFD
MGGRADPQTPITNYGDRVQNAALTHFRGIIGFFVPLFALSWQGELGKNDITVKLMWMLLFWTLFWQPVTIQASGFIPMFLLPMTGVIDSDKTCHFYFTDITGLFLVGNMIHLLMNNSGVDRRIALWFLCSGNTRQFSGKRLVYKASTAAFLLSAICNKFIVTSNIIEIMTRVLISQQGKVKGESKYDEVRYIVNNAIQTSSSIGSICVVHASYGTLFFRGIWSVSAPEGMEYPDIFNYLQYSCYAIPTALVMFLINVFYHMWLINRKTGKPMSEAAMVEVKKSLQEQKKALPKKIGTHEKLTIFFTALALIAFIFRWCKWLNMGWSTFRRETVSPDIPGIKDATVASTFLILLHVLPKTFGFVKYFTIKRKSQLPPLKPESAILFWRFVNKYTNYGYIFLLGAGTVLNYATRATNLSQAISAGPGHIFTSHGWCFSLLLVVMVAIILSNIMPGVAACVIFLPFVINMAVEPDAPVPWPKNVYLGALGVGMACSMTFMCPFSNTPAHYCHTTGKVPAKKMAVYSFLSMVICGIVIWLSICFWAPMIWDPSGEGISPVASPVSGAGGGGGGGGSSEAPSTGGAAPPATTPPP